VLLSDDAVHFSEESTLHGQAEKGKTIKNWLANNHFVVAVVVVFLG